MPHENLHMKYTESSNITIQTLSDIHLHNDKIQSIYFIEGIKQSRKKLNCSKVIF